MEVMNIDLLWELRAEREPHLHVNSFLSDACTCSWYRFPAGIAITAKKFADKIASVMFEPVISLSSTDISTTSNS